MKQYKAIFIDWDDTIGDFAGAAQKAQRDIYEKHRLSEFFPSYEAYWEAYHTHNVELWERYGRGEVTKEFLQRDRFLWPICKQIGIGDEAIRLLSSAANGKGGEKGKSPLVALADRMGEDFLALTNKHFAVLPGAAELVRYLAAKYPLTVVSNGFVEVQYYKIEHSGLKDCFTDIVLSEEVGIQKPQAGIFEEAIRRIGEKVREQGGNETIGREDILMIGDSYSSDVQGAKNAGIDQLWINENDNDNEKTATYVVTSLAEIYDIV